MKNSVVTVHNVCKFFGDVRALDDVSFEVQAGTVVGLLGPNGAGKTTLVRILTTLLDPDGGCASVCGFDVVREKSKVRPFIGLAGQYAAIDPVLTGRENLAMVGRLYHMPGAEVSSRVAELLSQFDLEDAADRQAGTYSGGMKRRLDLAASLVADPSVLFLDEPTTGLAFEDCAHLLRVLHRLVDSGNTVILIEHHLDLIKNADWVIDLGPRAGEEGGYVIAEGTPHDMAQEERSATGRYLKKTLLETREMAPTAD